MYQSDRFFRWAFNIFVFLMCANLGMVIALKSIYFQAEKRMKQNAAEVNFACGDYDNSSSYWQIPESLSVLSKDCKGNTCPESYWVNPDQADENLYVVAVDKPQPSQVIDGKLVTGHFVDVDLKLYEKPTTLVLVSKKMLQWNLKFQPPEETNEVKSQKDVDVVTGMLTTPDSISEKNAWLKTAHKKLKEVIVVGPDLVWIEGLPEDTKITYFNNEQICAYPNSWEELSNPGNEFRRFSQALSTYTGLNVTHFQGKTVGRHLQVPYQGTEVATKIQKQTRNVSSSSDNNMGLGMTWKREGKKLVASEFKYRENGQVVVKALASGIKDALFEKGNEKLYVIYNYQFGTWDSEKQKFTAIHLPLTVPAMHWPQVMTFNPLRSEIYIYNDDRGGEVFVYNVVKNEWRKLDAKFGYSFVSLYFDAENESLYGTRFKGQKIHEIVEFDSLGKLKARKELPKPLDFVKRQWRAQFIPSQSELWLKVVHPAHPGGDLHTLGPLPKKM